MDRRPKALIKATLITQSSQAGPKPACRPGPMLPSTHTALAEGTAGASKGQLVTTAPVGAMWSLASRPAGRFCTHLHSKQQAWSKLQGLARKGTGTRTQTPNPNKLQGSSTPGPCAVPRLQRCSLLRSTRKLTSRNPLHTASCTPTPPSGHRRGAPSVAPYLGTNGSMEPAAEVPATVTLLD